MLAVAFNKKIHTVDTDVSILLPASGLADGIVSASEQKIALPQLKTVRKATR